MAVEEFKTLTKVKDMMIYAYPVLAQFPKAEKFSLAQDIRHSMDQLLELTITEDKKYYKKTTLESMDVELAKLKTYVRLGMELNFIPFHKYEVWERHLTEIGKMIGGLMKSVNSKPKNIGNES